MNECEKVKSEDEKYMYEQISFFLLRATDKTFFVIETTC